MSSSKTPNSSMAGMKQSMASDYPIMGAGLMELSPAMSEPVRLLKVITNYGCGGTEKQVINLVNKLDRRSFELQFACLQKLGFFLQLVEQQKIPIAEFPIGKLYEPGTFMQQLRFSRFMREQKIQIMHSYNFYSNVFAIPAAKLAGVPVILASIRDQGIYLSKAQKLLQKNVCRLADRVLVNSESIRDWLLEEGYAEDRISIIKNGIDLSLYQYSSGDSGVRAELGIPERAPVVIMLSRLNPQKGVDDFIKAASLVHRHRPDTYFLIVGEKLTAQVGSLSADADYHRTLEDLAISLGMQHRIKFTGHRADVPQLLAEADISVLPSHSEGLSNTLLESMAAGLPVVTTNVGGNAELVKEGITGLLVPPVAPGLLADAIVRLLNDSDLARQMGAEAKQDATANFSMDRMVHLTQELYASQIARVAATQSS